MARTLGDRIGAAARGHQPFDAERGVGAAPLARAAQPVPRDLHHRFRGKGVVPAALPVAAAARRARGHGVASHRHRLPLPPRAAARRVPAGNVRRLPLLPWRALPHAPGAAASHRVLPDDLGRRRARRAAGRGGRATRLHRLLRARRRPRGARGARRAALRHHRPSGVCPEPPRAARRRRLRHL